MKLIWWLTEPLISAVLGWMPDAPAAVALMVPWPAWLPSWPLVLMFVAVLTAGGLFLLLRFARWIYGLIPVVQ